MDTKTEVSEAYLLFEQYKKLSRKHETPFRTGWTPASDDLKQVAKLIKKLSAQDQAEMLWLAFDSLGGCIRRACDKWETSVQKERGEHAAWATANLHWCPDPWYTAVADLASHLLRTKTEISDKDLVSFLQICCHASGIWDHAMGYCFELIDHLVDTHQQIDPKSHIGRLVDGMRDRLLTVQFAKNSRYATKLSRLLSDPNTVPLDAGEPWSDAVLGEVDAFDPKEVAMWNEIFQLAETANGARPSQRWTSKASVLSNEVGQSVVVDHLCRWLPLIDRPRADQPARITGDGPYHVLPHHADILKGLCWIAASLDAEHQTDELARTMGLVAIASYKKIPGRGMRLPKVGHAAVYALSQIPGRASLGQLAMLRIKVKFGQAQAQIEKALDAAAVREGLPRDEIEEIAVPSYGLDTVGLGTETFGQFTAEIRVGTGPKGATHAEIGFVNAAGKRLKSVPAAVKRDHAEELKELKAALKDIQKMLPAQRDRLDAMFVANRTWSYGAWRERYLDHALVGVLARRMIWVFDDGTTKVAAAWLADGFTPDGDVPAHGDGRLVRADGTAFEPDPDTTIVSLWHPVEAESPPGEPRVRADVEDWRRFYEDRGVRQPFKQAHREIYLLTDAEVRTGVYSNRFAAHVLRQHQCHALCQQRGWKSMLRIAADTEVHPAHKVLPAFGLRAEFWAESVGEEYGVDTLESGAYIHIATDQVRFYPLDERMNRQHTWGGAPYGIGQAPEPVRMDRIPPLAFSEIMRDADLFVGVASVGNNPQWQDGGPEGRFLDAWQTYSFGELSGSAETRRDLLGRLLPRLKIRDACTVTDRFLVVLGKKRTYKIHLGSGNILMEPGDQYLCIVPNSGMEAGPKGKIHLPFEGDRTLAIILSKAFMLAEDDKITDPTILSQIGRIKA